MIELKINSYDDRMVIVNALVNSGYTVSIRVDEKDYTRVKSESDFFVQIKEGK